MWAPAASPEPEPSTDHTAYDAAVVDVGSNSVRLVMYRIEGRALWTVFNEKVLAGLGRDMARTKKLSPTGVEQAIASLRRFRTLLDAAKVETVHIAATAAVREAKDGPAFVAKVKAETGLKLKVLTGAEEARLSALGVTAGLPDAEGVVGDLGGSSLELVRLQQGGEPGEGVTLPLGPLALGAPAPFDPGKTRERIDKILGDVGQFKTSTFHAVGGAWRNLALLHMKISGYPLNIVHEYEISGRDAAEAARFISRQSKGSLERIDGASRKRAETIPYAAAVLEALIRKLDIDRIVISAYGLREGLLLDAMEREVRRRDPLVEGAAALGGRKEAADALGQALETWLSPAMVTLQPVFGNRDPTLIAAACRLADLGARLHPDHRADLVFEQVLRAPIPGMNHAERAFLALTLFARFTAANTPPEPEILSRLLTSQAQRRARALGAAIRLGCDLSGKNGSLLEHTALDFDDEWVTLSPKSREAETLLGEQARKRADTLAGILGRKLMVEGQAG
ncbi:MAG TPA: Ppx/GppA phosphatase family protein [Caulobacteraceae bacterium]|nr:Ppx/GppA phosphatase family protein [Caulobacteraceae bacterium]